MQRRQLKWWWWESNHRLGSWREHFPAVFLYLKATPLVRDVFSFLLSPLDVWASPCWLMYVQSLTRLLQQVWIICDITNHMEANPGPVISKLKLNVDTRTYSSDIVSNEALWSKWGHLFLVMIHFLSVSNSFLSCVYVENWWKRFCQAKLSKFFNVIFIFSICGNTWLFSPGDLFSFLQVKLSEPSFSIWSLKYNTLEMSCTKKNLLPKLYFTWFHTWQKKIPLLTKATKEIILTKPSCSPLCARVRKQNWSPKKKNSSLSLQGFCTLKIKWGNL